jgi:hypothetical protein
MCSPGYLHCGCFRKAVYSLVVVLGGPARQALLENPYEE